MRRVAAPSLALALALVPGLARAQSAEEQARSAFEAGAREEAAGRTAEACALYAKSLKLVRELGPLRKVARCDADAGRVVEAKAELEELIERLPKDDPEAATLGQELRAVSARIGTIKIEAKPSASVARVRLDGETVESLGEPRPANPGEHRLLVERRDGSTDAFDVTVPEGKPLVFEVPPQPPRRQSPAAPSGPSGLWIGGWISVGIGAAALVGAAVTGGLVLAKDSDYEACQTGCEDLQSEGNTLLVANGVLWGVGIVGAGVGATLLIVDAVTAGEQQGATASVELGFPFVRVRGSF